MFVNITNKYYFIKKVLLQRSAMGRISVKENKNEYQLVRDTLKMSRDAVEEATNGLISANRLEKIENGSTAPRPEDVVLMADVYNEPRLCNYYCVNECAIGKSHVPAVGNIHELPQIAMCKWYYKTIIFRQ
jgi:hypothetical protein